MEPISFAASLITVIGLVATTSKKIHELQKKLGNSPKDVEHLLEQLQTFESLLDELKTQLQDHRNSAPPQETLQQVWETSLVQMQRDVQGLHTVLSKIEPLLKTKSRSSKFLLLARRTLNEKEVEQYQKKINTHCITLTSIQATVCGRKLGRVSENIDQLGEEDRAGFQSVSSQLSQTMSQLNSEVKTGFSTVSSQHTFAESANETRHQKVLAHLDNHAERHDISTEKMEEFSQQQLRSIDVNEAGFQAVHSSLISAASSNLEEHKTTHTMLSQCQGQIQQMLRNHLTFDTVGNGVRSSTARAGASNPISESTVFWGWYSYRMPIGMLNMRLNQTRQIRNSRCSTPQSCTESKVVVIFVPPPWLSRVVINYSMKLCYDLISDHWRWGATLECPTVNYNPFFVNAVESIDVEGVRRSFAEGLARPTDFVLSEYYGAVPWYENLQGNIFGPLGCQRERVRRHCPMLDYMIEKGLPGQDCIMILYLEFDQSDPVSENLVRNSVRYFSQHGGEGLDTGVDFFETMFKRGYGNYDWISDPLFNSSETWLVDDLSSFQICLIGIKAQADAVFCARLKKELACYRSPASSGPTPLADPLFGTSFGTASIQSHFRKLQHDEVYRLLSLLCTTGSIAMMKPFMDMGFDLDGDDEDRVQLSYGYRNMLGNAAAAGNMDIVCMLLEAGANGSMAIGFFLNNHKQLSDVLFGGFLELLVENARPASGIPIYDDPLLAVLSSSRALDSYPQAPEILLDRKVFSKESFGEEGSRVVYWRSYMFQAISQDIPWAVDFLLRSGACAEAQISRFFNCHGWWFESCTWLTFSVMCGAASCVDVLIQHGADVITLDGAGRSAIQLARNFAFGSHPRHVRFGLPLVLQFYRSTDEDAKTLAVVERAFNEKFQGTKSIEDYISTNLSNEQAFQPSSGLYESFLELLQTALGILFTPSQRDHLHHRLRDLYHDIRHIWSLSFYEALRMRSFYVLSYALLLAIETVAFIKGHRRIPMPSRYLLSAVAFLALALMWGSSLVEFDSFTAGSKAEMKPGHRGIED